MVSLTLCFRYIQAYPRLIRPYLVLLRHIKIPGIFRNILLQTYSKRYVQQLSRIKHIQIPGLFKHVMFQASSAIFITLDILRHICLHLGIFWQIQPYSESWHSQTYSCLLRHIQNPQLIQGHSKPQTYLVYFRHIIHVLLQSN